MIFLVIIFIILSCYVGASDMIESSKMSYFVFVGIFTAVIFIFNIIL